MSDNRDAIKFKLENNYRFEKNTKHCCSKCIKCSSDPMWWTGKFICHGKSKEECEGTESPVIFSTYKNHTCDKFKKTPVKKTSK